MALFDQDEAVSPKGAAQPSYLRDHRRRLRDRFLAGGAAAMPDYELLELVLFRAIPRQDVKPLARRLLERFGDFNHVISAPSEHLKEVKGRRRSRRSRAENRRSRRPSARALQGDPAPSS